MHSENGYPHPKSFKEKHLKALAAVLHLKAKDIQDAIDVSRHVYSPSEIPMPQENKDAFAALIAILSHERRGTLKTSYVLNLARTLYNGATKPAAWSK